MYIDAEPEGLPDPLLYSCGREITDTWRRTRIASTTSSVAIS